MLVWLPPPASTRYQRAANIGKALLALDVADHGTGDTILSADLPIPARIGADRAGIVLRQFVPAVAAFVGYLLFARRPFSVIRRIALAVVNTLKRQLRVGAVPHVGQEVGEGVPPLANLDATAAIVAERHMPGVIAAAKHSTPDEVFRFLLHVWTLGKIGERYHRV